MLTLLEKVDRLQRTPVFRAVRTESLARVAAIAEEVGYTPHHSLFRENDAADAMFVLLEGEVALLRDGRETRRVAADQVIGLLPLLAGGFQPESAVAMQAVRALRIDQQDFYDVMADDFGVTRGILRALVSMAGAGG